MSSFQRVPEAAPRGFPCRRASQQSVQEHGPGCVHTHTHTHTHHFIVVSTTTKQPKHMSLIMQPDDTQQRSHAPRRSVSVVICSPLPLAPPPGALTSRTHKPRGFPTDWMNKPSGVCVVYLCVKNGFQSPGLLCVCVCVCVCVRCKTKGAYLLVLTRADPCHLLCCFSVRLTDLLIFLLLFDAFLHFPRHPRLLG